MTKQHLTLHPSSFFDLSTFKHAALFDSQEFVWQALKKLEAYLEAQSLGKIEAEIPAGAFLVNPKLISIGKGSIVEPGAYIKGPCIIGENCTVRHGAYIRGGVLTGNDCVIGHDTEMKNVIMFDGAHAAHFAYLGDSILGNKVNLGAGTKCANLKLDKSDIAIHTEGRRISTQMRKLGAILGDRVQIGCNVVTNPGTLIGPDTQCYPCLNVGGVIPSKSIVKSDLKIVISSNK